MELVTTLVSRGDDADFAQRDDAAEGLVARAGQQALGPLRNRLRLVGGGFEWRDESEHARPSQGLGWFPQAVGDRASGGLPGER